MTTKTKRPMSEQARAAKAIRAKLKATWPTVRFSVTSDSFAGGNAVRVSWTDGPTERQVERLIHWHEAGTFDGMTDMYEYDRVHPNIPQAKYVQTQRDYSDDTRREAVAYVNQRYGYELEFRYNQPTRWRPDGWYEIANDQHTGHGWQSNDLHQRALMPQPFVCHACHARAHVGDDYCADCGTRLTNEHLNR